MPIWLFAVIGAVIIGIAWLVIRSFALGEESAEKLGGARLKQTREATGKDAQAFELTAEELEERVVPGMLDVQDSEVEQRVADHRHLAVSLAKGYAKEYASELMYRRLRDDLVEAGVVGLRLAAQNFDQSKGIDFSDYAVWWVREAIREALPRGGGPAPRGKPEAISRPNEKDFLFSAFYHERVSPREVGSILVFAHTGSVDEEVAQEAAARLLEQPRRAGARLTAGSAWPVVPLAKETVLKVTTEITGLEFESREATMKLWRDAQSVEFRFKPLETTVGQACNGWIHFWLEGILLASVPVTIFVARDDVPETFREFLEEANAWPYRKVFPSYSRKDSEIVERFETYAQAFGDKYMRDIRAVRTGEDWQRRILKFINNADVFQLFWSENASQSKHVQAEWTRALKVRKKRLNPHFVRPVYWTEEVTPQPPAELKEIHFSRPPI